MTPSVNLFLNYQNLNFMDTTTLEKLPGLFQVNDLALQNFKTSILGQVIMPDDTSYDEVRKVYNGMII